MFFLMSTILGILSEYIYMLARHSGNRPVYLISKESTSSVLDVQRKLNTIDGGGDFAPTAPDSAADQFRPQPITSLLSSVPSGRGP